MRRHRVPKRILVELDRAPEAGEPKHIARAIGDAVRSIGYEPVRMRLVPDMALRKIQKETHAVERCHFEADQFFTMKGEKGTITDRHVGTIAFTVVDFHAVSFYWEGTSPDAVIAGPVLCGMEPGRDEIIRAYYGPLMAAHLLAYSLPTDDRPVERFGKARIGVLDATARVKTGGEVLVTVAWRNPGHGPDWAYRFKMNCGGRRFTWKAVRKHLWETPEVRESLLGGTALPDHSRIVPMPA